jgi:hypothetical protein
MMMMTALTVLSRCFGQPWKVVISGTKRGIHCPFWEGNVAGEISEPYTKDLRSSRL